MKYLNKPVAYLQKSDFNESGELVNPNIPKNIPVIVMVQAEFCGYCTQAKPAFQQFAEKNQGKVFSATIQGDGDMPGEKELGSMLNVIDPTFQGYPAYIKFVNGKRVDKDIKGRDVKSLNDFAFD